NGGAEADRTVPLAVRAGHRRAPSSGGRWRPPTPQEVAGSIQSPQGAAETAARSGSVLKLVELNGIEPSRSRCERDTVALRLAGGAGAPPTPQEVAGSIQSPQGTAKTAARSGSVLKLVELNGIEPSTS